MKTTQSPAAQRRGDRASGFTLVELLTVIAIIVLLVGITIGILGFATKKGALSKAEGQLALIVSGLQRYEKEFGEFPEPVDNSGKGKGGAKALYQALSGDGDNHLVLAGAEGGSPSSGKVGSSEEPLVEGIDPLANKHGLVSNDLALVDPFGHYWRYRKHVEGDPGDETRNKTYDLWSIGDDRTGENEAKWIKNW